MVAADGSMYLGAWRDDIMWGAGALSSILPCSACMPPHLGPSFDAMQSVWLDGPISPSCTACATAVLAPAVSRI